MDKLKRLRRTYKTRKLIRNSGLLRLSVHKSSNHIYAQIIDDKSGITLVSSSTLKKQLIVQGDSTGNVESARKVGKDIAEMATAKGISKVAFDRSGFKYHGRVKALADSAREFGLIF